MKHRICTDWCYLSIKKFAVRIRIDIRTPSDYLVFTEQTKSVYYFSRYKTLSEVYISIKVLFPDMIYRSKTVALLVITRNVFIFMSYF